MYRYAFLCGCVGSLGDWPKKATEAERGTGRPMDKHSKQPPKRPTHTHKKHTETSHKLPTNLPIHRHTPIKNIPIHSSSYRRLDYIPKKGQLKNKPRRLNKPPKHCTSISVHVTFVVLWASMVLPWPLWASLGIYATVLGGRLWPDGV